MKIENLFIVGSGLMGSGIAQASAQSDNSLKSIVLQDVNQAALDKASTQIRYQLKRAAAKNPLLDVDQVLNRITFTTKLEFKAKNNLLVIEAVPEILDLKQSIFKQLNNYLKGHENVILVTNTSSLFCKEIAVHVEKLSSFAGLHFFNPVPLMKLVEVVKLETTSDDTLDALFEFVRSIGKVPVKCKDTQGFIVNRLLIPYLSEALQILERGDATIEDIDTALELGAGYPMGPFKLMDQIGLDTIQMINESWMIHDPSLVKTSQIINDLVKAGHVGKKSGKGFYEYSQKK